MEIRKSRTTKKNNEHFTKAMRKSNAASIRETDLLEFCLAC